MLFRSLAARELQLLDSRPASEDAAACADAYEACSAADKRRLRHVLIDVLSARKRKAGEPSSDALILQQQLNDARRAHQEERDRLLAEQDSLEKSHSAAIKAATKRSKNST